MYKDKIKRILRATFLIGIILLVLFFMITYFIGGPIIVNKSIDEKLLTEVEERNKLSGCSLYNRFVSDKTYYVAKCVAHYIVYNEDGNVLDREVVKEFDDTQLDIDISDYEVNIGYYNYTLVYVLKNENREVLIDYNTYEVLRDYTIGR